MRTLFGGDVLFSFYFFDSCKLHPVLLGHDLHREHDSNAGDVAHSARLLVSELAPASSCTLIRAARAISRAADAMMRTSCSLIAAPPRYLLCRRLSNRSRVTTKCGGDSPESRCAGGIDAGDAGNGYCAERFTAPECLRCLPNGTERFYFEKDACHACPSGGALAAVAGIFVALIVALVLLAEFMVHPHTRNRPLARRLRRLVKWLLAVKQSVGFTPKFKICYAFIGIATRARRCITQAPNKCGTDVLPRKAPH